MIDSSTSTSPVQVDIRPKAAPPSLRIWLVLSAALTIASLLAGAVAAAGNPTGEVWIALVGVGLLLALLAGYLCALQRFSTRASLSLTATSLCHRGTAGSPLMLPRDAVHRLIRVNVVLFPMSKAPSSTPFLLLLDAEGLCRLTLAAEWWGDDALRELETALGCAVDGDWNDPASSARRLRRAHPGAFAWWLRHLQLLVNLSVVVFIIGAAVIEVAAGHRR